MKLFGEGSPLGVIKIPRFLAVVLRRGGRSVGVFGKDRLPVLAELGNKTLGAWLRLS